MIYYNDQEKYLRKIILLVYFMKAKNEYCINDINNCVRYVKH